jgi:hypothetical protein
MTWLTWLALAAVVTAFAAVTGMKARGTRHIAGTQLMAVARLALWAVVVLLAYVAFRTYSSG